MFSFNRSEISFKNTHAFDDLIVNYIEENSFFNDFYAFEASPAGIRQAISSYQNSRLQRQNVKDIISKQYSLADITQIHVKVQENVGLLSQDNSFTVTTGNQLNIFSGPLYVFYKIISAINLSNTLNEKHPDHHFIPVFWMATEDHDIEEITSINLFGKSFLWDTEWKGIAGQMPLTGIEQFLETVEKTFGSAEYSSELVSIIKKSYRNSKTLAEATRKWINEFFGQYGLVILDGNERLLKEQFKDVMIDELFNQSSKKLVSKTSEDFNKKYYSQAKPREINLFYIGEGFRERIVRENNLFKILNTDLIFTDDEMKIEINNFPERFSPNVILRPLFQECILPNIAYVGGPAEIAYWLELKSLFEYHKIPMPVLFLRSCAMILEDHITSKMEKLNIKSEDLFINTDELIRKHLVNDDDHLSFHESVDVISSEFKKISKKVEDVDSTLIASVEAEFQKTQSSIKMIEDKLIRSLKKKNETEINQLKKLKEKLFPNGNLQEREDTMIPYFLKWGRTFIEGLTENMNPLKKEFVILTEKKSD